MKTIIFDIDQKMSSDLKAKLAETTTTIRRILSRSIANPSSFTVLFSFASSNKPRWGEKKGHRPSHLDRKSDSVQPSRELNGPRRHSFSCAENKQLFPFLSFIIVMERRVTKASLSLNSIGIYLFFYKESSTRRHKDLSPSIVSSRDRSDQTELVAGPNIHCS